MIRERYFKELAIVLQKEGFTPLSEQEQRLPVAWKGCHLCWITETGGVRYVPQDVNTIEAEHACAKAIDLAAAVQEYAAAMESAPVLEAKRLESSFCLLSEFNNVVLAGHQTEHGTQFITWVWDNNHTSLNFGCYYMLDYKGAKEAFALRSGLVSRGQFFDQEQMTEIYRASRPYGVSGERTAWTWSHAVRQRGAPDRRHLRPRHYNSSYGYYVVVDHGSGLSTLYAHNSKLLVRVGQTVEAGDIVSLSGSTGRSTGPHLHFEVRVNGERTNPRYYLPT